MKALLAKFAREEQGMETVEWAILAALIVAGLVTVISTLGSNVLAKFTTLKNATT
jgi:Flp pilus assembly pilin Flp